jgi:Prp8 binding protein
MSTAKRPAHEGFGSSQLVKRAKADANLGGSSAVAVVNGGGQNGALIQAVCGDTCRLGEDHDR